MRCGFSSFKDAAELFAAASVALYNTKYCRRKIPELLHREIFVIQPDVKNYITLTIKNYICTSRAVRAK